MLINNLIRLQKSWAIALAGICCLTLTACNDFLDVDSYHVASEDQQWTTLDQNRGALMGVYGLTRAALATENTHWLCGELRGGDFTVYNRTDLGRVRQSDLRGPYESLKTVANWSRFYKAINAANLFIEKAPNVVGKDKAYSENTLEYDVAQARALRAFLYFYMARIWGDVPLIVYSYDNGSFPKMERTPVETILNYAEGEFLAVVNKLPLVYGSSGNLYYNGDKAAWYGKLMTRFSAYAALAHIAAWKGNYLDVAAYADFIIGKGGTTDAPNYTSTVDLVGAQGIFATKTPSLGLNRIIGFNFMATETESTTDGHLESLTLAEPYTRKIYPEIYVSKDSLRSIFSEINDGRFKVDGDTAVYVGNMQSDIPVFCKVKVIQDGSADGDYAVFGSSIIFSRLEDIRLLRAEALAALRRGADALKDLNDIRSRRQLRGLSFSADLGNDYEKLISLIFKERRRELMGEGWRWYDLIREERLLGNHPEIGEMIANGRMYWPVADDVLKANNKLTQNEYWKGK